MSQSYLKERQWVTAFVLATTFFLGTFTLVSSTYDEKRFKKLSKQLSSRKDSKRKEAVIELAAMNDYRVIPLILEAMGDRSFSVKRVATDVLDKITDPRTADSLLTYLREPWKESDPSVSIPVHQAIRVLINTKDSRTGDCFLTHLNNTSYPEGVRVVAADALLKIHYQASYIQINDFLRGLDFNKSGYKHRLTRKLIEIKDIRFLDFYKIVMTLEGSSLKAEAARNVLELADKADTRILGKAQSILQEHSYLVEITYYNALNRPVSSFLSNLDGKRVAKRTITFIGIGPLSKVMVTTIDISTGKVLYETKSAYRDGEIIVPFLCLDEKGNIIYQAGKPVIMEKLSAIRKTKKFWARIMERIVNTTRHLYPCKNCSKIAGYEKCRYVW